MNISVLDGHLKDNLDGFSRVPKTLQGRKRRGLRKQKRENRKGGKVVSKTQKGRGAVQTRTATRPATKTAASTASRVATPVSADRAVTKREKQAAKLREIRSTGTAVPTKRERQAQRRRKLKEMGNIEMNATSRVESKSANVSNPGFSSVYVDNVPGRKDLQGFGRVVYERAMNGFSRRRYSQKDLQGLSLGALDILQGYGLGDTQDLEEWEYLVDIEHPDTLQGFPNWVLQGKGKERRAARRKKRSTRKESKRASKGRKYQRKKARKQERQDTKDRRREVRTARKEEKLLRKQTKRKQRELDKIARRERKQARIDARAERQRLRQESRSERQQMKSDQDGGFFENLADFGGDMLAPALFNQDGGFEDFTVNDWSDYVPGGISDFADEMSLYPSDEVLDIREDYLDEEFDDYGGKGEDSGSIEQGTSILLPIALAAGVIYMVSKDKKKKKRA